MARLNKTLATGLLALSTLGIAGVAQAQNSPSDLYNGVSNVPANAVEYHAAQRTHARSPLDARAAYVSRQFSVGASVAAGSDLNVRDAEIRDRYWSN